MVFSSPIFLFVFLPVVLLGRAFPGLRLRNLWLLVFSIIFYAWGEVALVFLLLGSTALNFFLGQQDEIRETQAVVFAPRSPLVPLTQITAGSMGQESGTGAVITRNPKGVGKVVLFRDSFAEAWIPFLGYHFREAIYLRQTGWNKPFLEREKPDVVIDEMVERLFNNQNPRRLLKSDERKPVD